MSEVLIPAETLKPMVEDALSDLKARETVSIDVRGRTPVTDWIIVTTGTSNRHVQSIAQHLVETAKAEGHRPMGVEGGPDSDWVLVDLGDAVVHVMTEESRAFYRLERMWEMDEACESISSS